MVLQLMRDNITVIPDGPSMPSSSILRSLIDDIDFLLEKTNFDNSQTVLAQMQK